MKKRILSILLMCCMVLTLLPTAAFAEESTETPPVCSCETACTVDNMNKECPVCGAENAIPQNCGQYIPVEDRTGENGSTERADDPNGPTELSAADQVQAMIDGLPNAEEVTEDNAEEVKAQLEAIDEAKEKLSDEEIDELDMTRYAEAAAALGALAAPMLLANDSPNEQFSLTSGGTYYFDLSGVSIPGTANESLPDKTMRYVPFTYAGTVDAYKLASAMAITEEDAEKYKYAHSLFVADYVVTHTISWDGLNGADLIFGKNYAAGGVDYTLRAPSAGSQSNNNNGKDDSSTRGIPKSNEWDAILDKANQDWKDNTSGYIKNWSRKYSFGQDNLADASIRAVRGHDSARYWRSYYASYSLRFVGFRPVLEILNADTLDSDGLKVVTLDLNGGKLGGSSDAIHIIVKNGSAFTAPASDGLTRPDGNTGSYFMWLGSDGKLYAPGANVPAEVTKLTVQWTAPTYAVTLNTNGGTINNGNVTEYTYGVGATLPTDVTRTGYTFKGWYDNENLTGSPVTAISNTETGNKEYWAKWEANAYTVTLNTNGGTINNGNVTEYTYGVGATLPTDVTRTGYTFKGWYDNENLTGSPVTAISGTEMGNKEYWAKWEINQYTITFDTAGGSVVTPITQNYGTAITAPADPTKTGYTFTGWDRAIPATMPAENLTITAQWTVNQYTIAYDLAGGTAEGNPDTYTIETGAFTLTNPTKSGYTFTGWSGTGLDGENNMTVTIPTGSTGNRTYTAHWRYNGGGGSSSSPSYPVSVPDKTDHGSVTVSPKNASAGSTVTITVKPDSGYVLETISVTDKNGNDLKLTDKGNGKYTFTMPASKVEIKVTFMEDNSVLNFFYDVPNDAYYYEAVKWAAENGITGGIGSSLFAPNQPCTRAQIVTFLWRAAGSPVVNYLMLFTDVDEGAYYAEAVRWAASTGIVTGLTETTFGTDSVCTRAQAAAMIYRCAQAQGKGFTGAWMLHLPFTDVPEWAYESVAWCYMNSVTTGVSETSFAPGNDCTRAQIVTFLWRAFGK